jgi:hypothetical protein
MLKTSFQVYREQQQQHLLLSDVHTSPAGGTVGGEGNEENRPTLLAHQRRSKQLFAEKRHKQKTQFALQDISNKQIVKTVRLDLFDQPPTSQKLVHKVVEVDEQVRKDPLFAGEYIQDIMVNFKDLELRHLPSATYMSRQRELTEELRMILVDWLMEIAEDCHLVAETLFQMINYVDRFMSKKNVLKHQLQLLGLAAIFVATKYEEIDAVTMPDLLALSEGSLDALSIIQMEAQLLGSLKFELSIVTSRCFATRYVHIASHFFSGENEDSKDFSRFPSLVYYLTEVSLYHYPMLHYTPSQVAIASIVLALHSLDKPCWSNTMSHHTGFKFPHIIKAVNELYVAWCAMPTLKYNIAFKKYLRDCHHKAAAIQPKPLFDMVDNYLQM